MICFFFTFNCSLDHNYASTTKYYMFLILDSEKREGHLRGAS